MLGLKFLDYMGCLKCIKKQGAFSVYPIHKKIYIYENDEIVGRNTPTRFRVVLHQLHFLIFLISLGTQKYFPVTSSFFVSGIYAFSIRGVEFSFDEVIYAGMDRGSMGSPFGPVLADIFVGCYESLMFEKSCKPTSINWMTCSPSIGQHLLDNPAYMSILMNVFSSCSELVQLFVLEAVYINIHQPSLCKQKVQFTNVLKLFGWRE